MSTEQEEKARSTVGLKDFLEDLKSVGRVSIFHFLRGDVCSIANICGNLIEGFVH